MILAIDPGSTCAGWSTWRATGATVGKPLDFALDACGLLRYTSTEEAVAQARRLHADHGVLVGRVVVELPQVYSQRHWKGDPNDLILVAATAGVIVGALGLKPVSWVKPHAWKGTVPKNVHNARVLDALKDRREIFDAVRASVPSSLLHNVIDAIGLGAWASRKGT